MPAWFSPFPFEPSQQEALRLRGWKRWSGNPGQLPVDGVALYATPDQLLSSSTLDLEQLLAGYQQLLALDPAPRLVSAWRLLAERPLPEPPPPDPLAAVITLWGLERTPPLLDAYLDLELRADLCGGNPDLAYGDRLQKLLGTETLLQAWRARAAAADAVAEQLEVSREDVFKAQQQLQGVQKDFDLTLAQLHAVQEELQHYFLLSQARKELLAEHAQLASQLLAQLAPLVSLAAAPASAA